MAYSVYRKMQDGSVRAEMDFINIISKETAQSVINILNTGMLGDGIKKYFFKPKYKEIKMTETTTHGIWDAMNKCEADFNEIDHSIRTNEKISNECKTDLLEYVNNMQAAMKDLQAAAIKLEE